MGAGIYGRALVAVWELNVYHFNFRLRLFRRKVCLFLPNKKCTET